MTTKKLKTLKISQLIKILLEYHKQFGDIPVFHQSDTEGNSYGTIDEKSISYMDDTELGKAMFIAPYEEYIDDELFKY
jgi:hypothetical protein